MIRILISEAAYAALGGDDLVAQRTVGVNRYGAAPEGMVPVFLATPVVDALNAGRGPGETTSDVILRTVKERA